MQRNGNKLIEMKKGILEVLLVHAEGIRHTNLIGRPAYYVITQCGNRVHESKVSSGKDQEACWNEKFRIYLGGIIAEGINKGILEVKPAPYNVVLEDDTYKGEIKIGLNFIINEEEDMETREFVAPLNEPRPSFFRSIMNLLKSSWLRFWVYCSRLICKKKLKEN
eukprot:XP_015584420.1 uncharacterized protein LOC8261880 isoform X3 [Ricinus communis]